MSGGLEKNIKKDLAITPNSGIGSKSKALHKKMGKMTRLHVREEKGGKMQQKSISYKKVGEGAIEKTFRFVK